MSASLSEGLVRAIDLTADRSNRARQVQALDDLRGALQLRRLVLTLGWLDIKLRYRGSVLGPFWLTMSTAVMVGALGFLYSALFKMNLHEYLPFMAVSLVLWNFVSALVGEACTCFLSAEGTIRSMRLPFTLQAGRTVVRNVLVLAHNAVVIVVVFAIFRIWAGAGALLALPGFALWLIDAIAACLLFGCFCARFRDIPPIVASIMQIAFFVSPIIWKPELVGKSAAWLPLNPFFSLLEIVRGPLLGTPISWTIWLSALGYSAALCAAAWLLFARVRGRIAFWV